MRFHVTSFFSVSRTNFLVSSVSLNTLSPLPIILDDERSRHLTPIVRVAIYLIPPKLSSNERRHASFNIFQKRDAVRRIKFLSNFRIIVLSHSCNSSILPVPDVRLCRHPFISIWNNEKKNRPTRLTTLYHEPSVDNTIIGGLSKFRTKRPRGKPSPTRLTLSPTSRFHRAFLAGARTAAGHRVRTF